MPIGILETESFNSKVFFWGMKGFWGYTILEPARFGSPKPSQKAHDSMKLSNQIRIHSI